MQIPFTICALGLTLQEALELAYYESDEDDGGLVNNLSRRQLSAPAEIVLHDNTRIGGINEPRGTEHTNTQQMEIDDETEPNKQQTQEQVKTQDEEVYNYYSMIKVSKPQNVSFCQLGDLEPPKHLFPEPDYSKYSDMSCVQLFELFFSDNLLHKILVEKGRYALFKNCPDPSVSISEMKVFLAILLLSGYNNLPSKRSYWENSSDMKNILVSETMRRDRFLQICRFMHFADNNALDAQDKMFKLRLLTDTLTAKFQEHFIPEQILSYDESMIRYFGRHGCKQFIRGKPVRFGYKVWSLNTPSGYLVNFEIYQGKNPRTNNAYQELFGNAVAPLIHMLEELAEKRCYRYNVFFDNLFTGMNLLSTLKANGYGATGTVRDNRIPKECPMVSKKDLMKGNRGDFSSALEKNAGIIFVRWKDNSVVTMASTCFGVAPIKTVERFSRKEKKNVFIPRPDVVLQYNNNMGGTDLMDGNIACYRIGIRSKKWYWSIFTYLIDAAVQNAWIIYRKTGRNISQLAFRRNIVQTYLTRFKNEPKGAGRTSKAPGSDFRVSDDVRYDGMHHYVVPTGEGGRRRCAGALCKSRVRTMCQKCNVGLCIECFKDFHVQ